VKSKELFPAMFSRNAAAYQQRLDGIMTRKEASGRQRVIELLDLRPGMRVLDLACGPGTLSKPIAALVAPDGELVGVDLAEGMIQLARAAGIPNASFQVMDIEQLAFPDAWFDAAACGHGLQFVPDLARALGEAHRVLRPGARFAASVPLSNDNQRPWMVIDEVVDRWLPPAPAATDQQSTRSMVADRVSRPRAERRLRRGPARGDRREGALGVRRAARRVVHELVGSRRAGRTPCAGPAAGVHGRCDRVAAPRPPRTD